MRKSKLFTYERPDNKVVAVMEISCSKPETLDTQLFMCFAKDLVWQLGRLYENTAPMSNNVFITLFMKENFHLEEEKKISQVIKEKSKLLSDNIKIEKMVKFTIESYKYE